MNYVICDACMGRGEQGRHPHIILCSTCCGSGRIKILPHHNREYRFLSIKQFAFALAQSAYGNVTQRSR